MIKFVSILGKPGSGKSTLAKNLGFPIISAGDLARKYLPTKAAQGLFVNQRRMGQLVGREAKKLVNEKIVILEGTPLSRLVLEELEKDKIELSLVIYLKASDNVLWERLSKRGRETDIKHFKRRLRSYRSKTKYVIDDFRKQGILVTKDASKPMGDITISVKRILRRFEQSKNL